MSNEMNEGEDDMEGLTQGIRNTFSSDDTIHASNTAWRRAYEAEAERQRLADEADVERQRKISIRETKELIERYGLQSSASRVHASFQGNKADIEQFLMNKYKEKEKDSSRSAKSSGVRKGGNKSRRSTRGRRHSKKHKRVHHTRRKQSRRHRHSHRRHHRH